MTLIEHYRRLIAYDAWANREALHSLRAAGRSAPERALAIMSHIAAAERVWLERLNHRGSKPPVWPELSLEQVEQELETVSRDWKAILAPGEAELARSVDYYNSKGERWVNSV